MTWQYCLSLHALTIMFVISIIPIIPTVPDGISCQLSPERSPLPVINRKRDFHFIKHIAKKHTTEHIALSYCIALYSIDLYSIAL